MERLVHHYSALVVVLLEVLLLSDTCSHSFTHEWFLFEMDFFFFRLLNSSVVLVGVELTGKDIDKKTATATWPFIPTKAGKYTMNLSFRVCSHLSLLILSRFSSCLASHILSLLILSCFSNSLASHILLLLIFSCFSYSLASHIVSLLSCFSYYLPISVHSSTFKRLFNLLPGYLNFFNHSQSQQKMNEINTINNDDENNKNNN